MKTKKLKILLITMLSMFNFTTFSTNAMKKQLNNNKFERKIINKKINFNECLKEAKFKILEEKKENILNKKNKLFEKLKGSRNLYKKTIEVMTQYRQQTSSSKLKLRKLRSELEKSENVFNAMPNEIKNAKNINELNKQDSLETKIDCINKNIKKLEIISKKNKLEMDINKQETLKETSEKMVEKCLIYNSKTKKEIEEIEDKIDELQGTLAAIELYKKELKKK